MVSSEEAGVDARRVRPMRRVVLSSQDGVLGVNSFGLSLRAACVRASVREAAVLGLETDAKPLQATNVPKKEGGWAESRSSGERESRSVKREGRLVGR